MPHLHKIEPDKKKEIERMLLFFIKTDKQLYGRIMEETLKTFDATKPKTT
jgi:hypothetical protein